MVSFVLPCFNEWEVLESLHARLTAAAEAACDDYEVIAVDDGSEDRTWHRLQQIAEQDRRWKLARFSRNFGHQAAVSAGISFARGNAVIIMDADLQDPPELVPRLLKRWREGYDVVFAVRRRRQGGLYKRSLYSLFYRLLSRLSRVRIPRDAGDFCLLDRRVAAEIDAMPEHNRFLRGLRAWTGFRQIGVEYDRPSRELGSSKYDFPRLVALALDGILSFSAAPLRILSLLGLGMAATTFLAGSYYLGRRMTVADPVPGFATQTLLVLFLGGLQLAAMGLVGEYVGRIYDEVKRRPLWIVREGVGLPPSSNPAEDESPGRARTGDGQRRCAVTEDQVGS